MKTIFSTVILLFMTVFTFAQNNTVQGKIVDINNNSLPGVNVFVKNSLQGSETDLDGRFVIKNIKGNQILVISYVGYKTKEIKINKSIDLGTITIYEGNELLQEIVLETRNNKFSRKKTAYVSKLPLKDIENPQVYSTVTSELLESQIITNIDDALNNATGISKLWESTGRSPDNGTGWFSTRGFATQPALVDGMPGYVLTAVDPSYIERIEVVKGPSATLFGSTVSSLGGLINIVTKKPKQGTQGSVAYTAGSFGLNRISADVNTAISRKNAIYFRLNTSYLTQDSWQDAGFRNSLFVAPSLSYRINNKLNVSLGFEYSKTEQTNPSMLFVRRGMPLLADTPAEMGVNPNKSYTSNDISLKTPMFNIRGIVDYKLSDNWTSQTIMAGVNGSTKGYYQYNIDGAAAAMGVLQPFLQTPLASLVAPILAESGTLLQRDAFARIFDYRDIDASKFNIQQNFTGDFKIGNTRNRLVIGLDYVIREGDARNKSGNPVLSTTSTFPSLLGALQGVDPNTAAALNAQLAGFPYFDAFVSANGSIIPSSFTPNAKYNVSKSDLDAVFANVPVRKLSHKSSTFAVYASDVINITPNLTANVGLRIDYFDQQGETSNTDDGFTKTTFSPTAGIVYQPIPSKLSVFTNFQTGFINNDPVYNAATASYDLFEPTKAKQFETGIKTNLDGGRLNLGVSYYHITANDRLISDPRSLLFPQSLPTEETTSNGFEFEVNYNPISGLNIRGGYAFNDSKITKTTIAELQDRRPEEAGPESTYNLWGDYTFDKSSFLKNVGLGFGLNGASDHHTMNSGVTGRFTLPSYTIYNTALYYNTSKFKVGFKINNLTDKVYYKGWSTINAQAPRAFLGNITYKF